MTNVCRLEEAKDRDEVYRIHQSAFERNDEADLVERLRTNSQFNSKLSFVALHNGKLVGHVLFTPVLIDSKPTSCLALAPLSILKEYQNQGIGSLLMQYALNEVKAQGYSAVIVLGHENYYPRFGFLPAKNFHLRPSFPLKRENCYMVLELIPNALAKEGYQGIVQYLPEFGL